MLLKASFTPHNVTFEQIRLTPHAKRFPDNGETELAGRFKGLQIFASGTHEFLKEVTEAVRRDQPLIHDGMLDTRFENPGLLIIWDKKPRVVLAQTDLLGVFPAFWSASGEGFALSDYLSHLHSAIGGETDEVGVAQIVSMDHTIGQRTLFKNIKRLRAGESLRFDLDTQKVRLKDTSSLWARHDSSSQESLIKTGSELLVEACRPMAGTLLMMSAGWDSRTLLAGAFGAGIADQVRLYYHGDTDSREARIIRQQAERFGLRLTMRKLDTSLFDHEFLKTSFELYEDASHPHWHQAARFAAEDNSGVDSVCAGIFGEIIGGITGPAVLLDGWKKMAAAVGYITGVPILRRPSGASQDINARHAASLLRLYHRGRPWYINEEVWRERFQGTHELTDADIDVAVARYIDRGVERPEELVAAFRVENRYSQITTDQLRSAATIKPMLAPYANREFLEFSCGVAFERKAYRSLNQKIVKKISPGLLEYPTAAVLCRAERPILAQESTRAIRRAAEDGQWWMYRQTNGKVPAPNLGWPNFQFLKHSSVMRDMIDDLNSPFWDKKEMTTFIDNYGSRNYHGLQGVMMKIKTLDLFGVA